MNAVRLAGVVKRFGDVVAVAGAPQAMYDQPANTFVATFLGSPGMNLLPVAQDELFGFRPEHLQPAADGVPPSAGAVAPGAARRFYYQVTSLD